MALKYLAVLFVGTLSMAAENCMKTGDVLVSVNGVKVTEENTKRAHDLLKKSGKLTVRVLRDGKEMKLICGGNK